MKPALAAVGSATVAVLSQSSGIEWPFIAKWRGHVVTWSTIIASFTCCCINNSAVASTTVVSARRGHRTPHHLVLMVLGSDGSTGSGISRSAILQGRLQQSAHHNEIHTRARQCSGGYMMLRC